VRVQDLFSNSRVREQTTVSTSLVQLLEQSTKLRRCRAPQQNPHPSLWHESSLLNWCATAAKPRDQREVICLGVRLRR
jgi:hypothetical protein